MSIKVSRCRTLKGVVATLTKYAEKKEMLFRGHRNSSYRLETTLKRAFKYNHNESWNPMIDELVTRYISRLKQIGQLPFESKDFRIWMEYARHQGLPTPYIDFSLSPFVALYFAFSGMNRRYIERSGDKYAAINIINTHALLWAWNRGFRKTGSLEGYQRFRYEEDSFFISNIDGDSICPANVMKLFYTPSVVNARMINQRAVLLYDTSDYISQGYKDLEDLLESVGDFDGKPILTRIMIPKKLYREVFQELDRRGISGISLYQSSEGVIQDLINEWSFNSIQPSPQLTS